jgi:outer membrane receptor protein involved in Fe transport
MVAFVLFVTTAAAAIAGPPLRAPTKDDREEIVVTGERVPRSLRQTASSVAVVTAREIEVRPADRVEQLLAAIPNVQLGSGTDGPVIRGQDSTGVVRELFAFLGGTRPRATLTIDGRAVTYNEYINGVGGLWDVERVEIFRSPQTTTQGRNSIAGGIFVTTHEPTYHNEVRARAAVGNYGSRQASALLSGPIVRDQLAVRFAGDFKVGRNSSDMADAIEGADLDRDDHNTLRVKLLAEPRELPGLRLEAIYAHTGSQSPQFEAVAFPFEKRSSPVPERTVGVMKTNVNSITATLALPLSNSLSAQSIVSHGDGLIRRFGLPGLGNTRVDTSDYSGETILRWQVGSALKIVGGVHHATLRQRQAIDITGLRIGVGSFADRQRSTGLFGEVNWRPRPRLSVTAGLRRQQDAQDRAGQVGPVGPGITVDYGRRFGAWLPKLSLAYDVATDVTLGVLAQRAFNPGGTTVNLATRAQDDFDAEALWNYEAFVRASFARGRGTIAINVFDNDIHDAQRPQTIEFVASGGGTFNTVQIANAPSARSRGMEVDVGVRPTSRLHLQLGMALLDTKIRRTLVRSDPILGKKFQRAPVLGAAASIDWRPVDAWSLSAQLRGNSAYYSDDANSPARRIDGSMTLDARAAFTRRGSTFFGYVRNAFDNFYLTYLFTPTLGTAGDPREFGIGIDKNF